VPDLGIGELLLITAIVLLLFGGARIAAIGRGLGGGLHEFRKIFRSGNDDPPPEDK
jgi:sec-independent protein translocase protein TatA